MIFEKYWKPEKLTSKDPKREHLASVYLDTEKRCLVATNGAALVRVPVVEIEEGDVSGPLTPESLQAARKEGSKKMPAQMHCNGKARTPGGVEFPRPEPKFPPYEQVMVNYEKDDLDVVRISFDPRLLRDIADAMDSSKGVEIRVKIPKIDKNTFRRELGLDPILVVGKDGESRGVLMPMRF